MVRKSFLCLFITTLLLSMVFAPVINATEVDLAPNAKSAVLIDQDTNTILFEKNSNEKLSPASLTKIMTMLLIMEAIDTGKINYTDKVRVSEYAASMGGSQIFLEEGEEMSVEDLLKGIAVASGNDASVAMAEYIAGSEEVFVSMMNDRVKELGLTNTHFVNSNGLPVKNHYSTAHDIAIMSRELLKHENITKFTGVYQDYLRKDTSDPFWLVNTNRLVRFYDGVDGLKTGFTSEAMFCLSATAKKDKLRVTAVVLGEPNTKTRSSDVTKLLDYAFSQYKNEVLYEKNQQVADVKVEKGKTDSVLLITPNQISLLMKKGEQKEDYEQTLIINKNINAPIKKGGVLGEVQTIKDDKIVNTYPIVAADNVEKANLFDMIKETAKGQLFIK
ncbi:MAG: D-alanyl-D-alanine carboxypeptidase family protein [Vulcanibacillus sp.]